MNSSGTSVLTGDATTNTFVCLPNDCYTVLMYDSWGDGWGNNFTTGPGTVTLSLGAAVIGSG